MEREQENIGNLILPHVDSYLSFDMIGGDVTGDVLAPPFEDNSFDTVLCTQVMEHVKEPWDGRRFWSTEDCRGRHRRRIGRCHCAHMTNRPAL